MTIFPVSRSALGGFVDWMEVDPSGILRIVGWYAGEFDEAKAPTVWLDGHAVPFLQAYRYLRPDAVVDGGGGLLSQTGLALDYLLPEALIGERKILEIDFGWEGEGKTRFEADLRFVKPHHRGLLEASTVLHREHIYGSGPPNAEINPEVLALAKSLKGPVLDFGCGRGLLVGKLRALGIEAYGLEIDTPIIREWLTQDVADHITLYDGTLPTAWENGRFASVVCSEVLEHISEYEAAVVEIARLVTERVLFTVPDAGAIPLGFRHGVVPWHLLEGTHVNFFTQQSLKRLLGRHFSRVEFGRVGGAHLNDTPYYVSLAAMCLK